MKEYKSNGEPIDGSLFVCIRLKTNYGKRKPGNKIIVEHNLKKSEKLI